MKENYYKEGVWYKKNNIFIVLYNADKKSGQYSGYWGSRFRNNLHAFSDPKEWTPATKHELNNLGQKWREYPWVNHDNESQPVIDMTTSKNYKYAIIKDGEYKLLLIEDLKKPGKKSVTNDIERIYNEICIKENDLLYNTKAMIFCKDSEDQWDQYTPQVNLPEYLSFITHQFKDLVEVIEYWEQSRK